MILLWAFGVHPHTMAALKKLGRVDHRADVPAPAIVFFSFEKQTTLLAMLTGMTPTTGGSAFIVGRDVVGDMSNIRNSLGVCPQHDILYPVLTVREHLRLYAVLKGVPHAQLEEAIEVRHSV